MIQLRPRQRTPQGNPGRNRRVFVSRIAGALAMALLMAGAGAGRPLGLAQEIAGRTRVVQGIVYDAAEKPLANAVVYLRNQKTMDVETYITGKDGRYRFGELGSDNDMQVWAAFQGGKSKTRTISSFDSKQQFIFDLKVASPK